MNLSSFFTELRRRRVYRVAIGYAIAAWLVVQIGSTVLPTFHVPEWILQALIVLVALGFPVALVLAWAFDVTPSGIHETPARSSSAVNRKNGWLLGAAGLVIACLAVGAYALWHRSPAPEVLSGSASDSTPAAAPAAAAPSRSAIPDKSIAVLPFLSLSKDEENAFFADGVQDQILTDLAKVAGLKVISRTSVMQYRNAAARNLREIAQQLGVVHVLEGSVQRASGKVRVTAQLIDARNDAHEWAENYDRPIDDVFAIQTEIAKAITEQLQVRISPGEEAAMSQVPTTDLIARNLYLKARELRTPGPNDPNGKQNLLEGIRLLNEALARDPNFFQAYILLARLHDDFYWAGFEHTPERLALVDAANQSAARLQPDAGELHVNRAAYAYHAHRDYDGARAELDLARKTLPNDAEVYYIAALLDRRQARWNEALHNFGQALELDPRNFLRLDEAGLLYQGLRRYAESNRLLERALAIRPDYYFVRSQLATNAFLERGDIRLLHDLTSKDAPEQPGWAEKSAVDLFVTAMVQRDPAMASRALAAMTVEGYQDTNSNLLVPRGWYAGLAARTFGDTTGGQAAFTAARVPLEKIVRQQPDYAEAWTFLGLVDAGLGRNEDAIREGRRACELLPPATDALTGPFLVQNLAQIYAWAGEKDLALQELSTAAKLPFDVNYGELKLGPQWDSLRGDPRFEKIVADLAPQNLPAQAK